MSYIFATVALIAAIFIWWIADPNRPPRSLPKARKAYAPGSRMARAKEPTDVSLAKPRTERHTFGKR